jgi:hypothetical protein
MRTDFPDLCASANVQASSRIAQIGGDVRAGRQEG